MVMSIYYKKTDMEDEKGNPTSKQIHLRKELAKVYLPQLDFENLDEIIKRVDINATDDKLQDDVSKLSINKDDLEEVDQE